METISRRQSFSEKGINVMSEKEKIIVFSSREICYQSSSFFANQMADAFDDLGQRKQGYLYHPLLKLQHSK